MPYDELDDLKEQMAAVVAWRRERIAHARELVDQGNRIIAHANSTFDRVSYPIGRRIRELLADGEAVTTRTQRPTKPIVLDGLTDREQQHYHELLTKSKRKGQK